MGYLWKFNVKSINNSILSKKNTQKHSLSSKNIFGIKKFKKQPSNKSAVSSAELSAIRKGLVTKPEKILKRELSVKKVEEH